MSWPTDMRRNESLPSWSLQRFTRVRKKKRNFPVQDKFLYGRTGVYRTGPLRGPDKQRNSFKVYPAAAMVAFEMPREYISHPVMTQVNPRFEFLVC
jgi:hypothetical protein